MRLLFLLNLMLFPLQTFSAQIPAPSSNTPAFESLCESSLQHVSGTSNVYAYRCPKSYYLNLGEKIVIADVFTAEGKLARRAQFWKKIYNQFGIRDYVIHTKPYPELIFEIVQQSYATKQNIKPKKLIKRRVKMLEKTLIKMHKNGVDLQIPLELAIERQMNYIKDPKKYLLAAKGLRSQRGQLEFFQGGFENAKSYLPHIKPYFRQLDIPEELAYIAFVESSFNLKAVSKVGASGVYQIMPFVARKMMILDEQVDERRDPIKSGAVAARLFKTNFRLTGSWPLAVTAYNHGPFGIRKAIRRTGKTTLAELIDSYESKSFGFASKNFYAEFLGAIMTLEEHDLMSLNVSQVSYRTERLPRSISIGNVLKKFGISRKELRSLNPDILKRMALSDDSKLPKGYRIKLPGLIKNFDGNS